MGNPSVHSVPSICTCQGGNASLDGAPMFKAIRQRDFPAFQAQLAAGGPWAGPPEGSVGSAMPAFMWTIDAGWREAFETMADCGADLEARGGISGSVSDHRDYTPLLLAAYRNHPEIGKSLLDRGARRDAAEFYGFQAMSVAAMNGSCEFVRMLHANGFDLDRSGSARSGHAVPPTMAAILFDNLETLRTLLSLGASPDAAFEGKSALRMAATKRFVDGSTNRFVDGPLFVEALLGAGAGAALDRSLFGQQTLLTSALDARASARTLTALLSAGADPHQANEQGLSAYDISRRQRGEAPADAILAWCEAADLRLSVPQPQTAPAARSL